MIDRDDPNYGDELYANPSLISVCCGEPQMNDSDICSNCGEHTSFEKDTEDELKDKTNPKYKNNERQR